MANRAGSFKSAWKSVSTVAIAFMAGNVFCNHVAVPTVVLGPSMAPTLNPDRNAKIPDIALLVRTSPQDIRADDIVVLTSPSDPTKTLIKRVKHIHGDEVHTVSRSGLRIDGMVPEFQIWVEGDNGPESMDSRDMGCIHSTMVLGTVRGVIFPPWRWTTFPRGRGQSMREALDEVEDNMAMICEMERRTVIDARRAAAAAAAAAGKDGEAARIAAQITEINRSVEARRRSGRDA